MTSATNKMTDEDGVITGEVVVAGKEVTAPARNRKGGRHTRLQPYEELALKRELAAGDIPQKVLAAKYDMTQPGISAFKRRHLREIDEIKQNISDQFAGLPLARKENRLAAYEREIEMLNAHPHASHHEWSKARQMAYRNMAEELGALPPRQSVTIIPVTHVIEGVNVADL